MALEFGADNLTDSARENFVGTIIEAKYPCDCELCQKGAETLEASGQTWKPSLHIQISPVNVYDKTQHEWFVPSKTKVSKWGALNIRLDELGLASKMKSEKDLVNKTFEFESTMVKVGFGDKEVPCWLPTRLLTKKEVDKVIEDMAEEGPDIDDLLPDKDDDEDDEDDEYEYDPDDEDYEDDD